MLEIPLNLAAVCPYHSIRFGVTSIGRRYVMLTFKLQSSFSAYMGSMASVV